MDILSILNRRHNLFLALIILLAVALRLFQLDRFETWDDEKLSVRESQGFVNFPFKEGVSFTGIELQNHNILANVMASTVKGDGGNGVLYSISLHFWTQVFGCSDYSVRLLSVLLGMIMLLLIYRFSMQLFNNKVAALLVLFFVAIHPQFISYAREARAYALALVFTLSATYLLWQILAGKGKTVKIGLLYGLCVAAAFLSHYSTVYIVAAHAFFIIVHYKTDLKSWLSIFQYCIFPFFILFVWFYFYGSEGLGIISQRNQEYVQLSQADPGNTFYMKTSLYSVTAGWFQNVLSFCGITFTNMGYRIALLIPLLIFPFLILLFAFKESKKSLNTQLYALWFLVLSSLLYATLLSCLSGHIIAFQQLYSIFSVPYFMLPLGLSIYLILQMANTWLRKALLVAATFQMFFLFGSTLSIYWGNDSPTKSGNTYAQMAEKIRVLALTENPDFVIRYRDAHSAMELNKYLVNDLERNQQVVDNSNYNAEVSLFFPLDGKLLVLSK